MCTLERQLIADFIKMGSNPRNAAATYQVYIELSEVRRMFEINYNYNDSLQRMFLTAKTSKSSPISTFIPISNSENVSIDLMQQMIAIDPNNSVYLAILSGDSTCVYYELKAGLVDPTLVKTSNLDLRQKHDGELIMKRNEIEQQLKLS